MLYGKVAKFMLELVVDSGLNRNATQRASASEVTNDRTACSENEGESGWPS